MIKVTVEDHIDLKNLADKAEKGKRKAVMATAVSLKKDAEPYVRFQTGMTARSADFSNFREGEVSYTTPYAREAYYNERSRVSKDVHPLACARWAEVAWNAKADRYLDLFKKIMTEALK